MKFLALIFVLLPQLAAADEDGFVPSGFQFTQIYMINGIELEAVCDCEKEVPGSFWIEVTALEDQHDPAKIAAHDMALNFCVHAGFDAMNVALAEFFESGRTDMWIFAGDCQ